MILFCDAWPVEQSSDCSSCVCVFLPPPPSTQEEVQANKGMMLDVDRKTSINKLLRPRHQAQKHHIASQVSVLFFFWSPPGCCVVEGCKRRDSFTWPNAVMWIELGGHVNQADRQQGPGWAQRSAALAMCARARARARSLVT